MMMHPVDRSGRLFIILPLHLSFPPVLHSLAPPVLTNEVGGRSRIKRRSWQGHRTASTKTYPTGNELATAYGAGSSPSLCSPHSDGNSRGSKMHEDSGDYFLDDHIKAATIGGNFGWVLCIDLNIQCANCVCRTLGCKLDLWCYNLRSKLAQL
jgi:hypothetical protein